MSLVPTSHHQDAVRILVLLHTCGERDDLDDAPREDAVAVIRAESRLQALDFWLRNPDYLAHEVLNRYEARGDPSDVSLAAQLLADPLRAFPTLRHLFGAYTEIDLAMSLLRSKLLAWDLRRPASVRRRRDLYLLARGEELVLRRLPEIEDLSWYVERARVVGSVAGNRHGRELKDHQKRLATYREIPWGNAIEPIATYVQARIDQLGGTP